MVLERAVSFSQPAIGWSVFCLFTLDPGRPSEWVARGCFFLSSCSCAFFRCSRCFFFPTLILAPASLRRDTKLFVCVYDM